MANFLDIKTIESRDLKKIIQTALELKKSRSGLTKGAFDSDRALDGHIVALIFEKPSTRTRVSFDVGVRQMGGQTIVLSGNDMQLGHGETIADTARVLSRYVDLIMLRTYEEATLHEMAQFAEVPVINGLTNFSHPCQIMADIMTYEEHRGSIKGKKIIWQGCEKFVRPFITGTSANCAISCNVASSYVRSIIKSTYLLRTCLLYTSPSPRDVEESRMPSSA